MLSSNLSHDHYTRPALSCPYFKKIVSVSCRINSKPGLPLIISKLELTGREVVTCMHTRQRGRKDVGRTRSTRHARFSRHSQEKREKLAPVLQADNKETGGGTEILEKKRDKALSL